MSAAKLGAIYSALDAGNPRQALRLCEQVKAPSPIVLALTALAHSRSGNSEEALAICHKLEAAAAVDQHLAETVG